MLKVWLPLDGDLHNQGISDLIFSAASSNTTTNTNGKIGTCYTNNSHSAGGLISDKPIFLGSQYSMCCWFKFTDLEASSNLGGGLISQHRYSKNTGFGLTIKYVSSTTGYLSVNTGTGSGRTFNTYCGTTLLQANTWYHACGTYDGINIKIYVNGILEKTQAYNMSAPEDYLTIFCWSLSGSSGATIHSDYKLNGALNDVRIYDHCLSAAEVKEIAQGLILHYKLDSIGFLRGSENFILESHQVTSGGNASGITRTYMEDGSLKIIAASGNGNYASIGFAKNSNDNVGAKLTVGDTYTLSCDIKVESGTTLPTIFINSGNGYKRLQGNFTLGQWIQVYYTSTWADPGTGYGNISLHLGFSGLVGTYYFKNFKLEKSSTPTAWCPSPLDDNYNSYMPTSVFDSSGYNNNAISNGSQPITIDSDTSRYSMSTKFVSGSRIAMPVASSTCLPTDAITVNIWVKSSNLANRFLSCTEGGGWNFEVYNNSYIRVPIYISGKGYTYCNTNTSWSSISDNQWHMLSFTYDKQVEKIYLDGEMILSSTSSYPGINIGYSTSTPLTLGAEAQTIASPIAGTYVGNLSDLRIYCTPLLDTDIKQLYNVGMKIDKLGSVHSFEFIEQQSNMIFPIELSRSNLEFTNGLSRYTQSNCQVTLTDQGYHIYRPPNLTTANNGNTMWGGLKLVNQKTDTIAAYDSNRDNSWGLQKGHTYFAAFHAKGKSSNSTSWGWANNMGWSGGGVNASPTIITNIGIPSDFQGEKDCIFIFTINDDIAKNCTSAYSSYVANTTYLSYRHLTFGWGYSSTGALGTDLYLTDLRLYDITNYMAKITKQGQVKFYDFIEQLNKAQIRRKSEFLSSNFIER